MRLNKELYIQEVIDKYGINLKGSGQKIHIMYDSDYIKGGCAPESSVYTADDRLSDYIDGGR